MDREKKWVDEGARGKHPFRFRLRKQIKFRRNGETYTSHGCCCLLMLIGTDVAVLVLFENNKYIF